MKVLDSTEKYNHAPSANNFNSTEEVILHSTHPCYCCVNLYGIHDYVIKYNIAYYGNCTSLEST